MERRRFLKLLGCTGLAAAAPSVVTSAPLVPPPPAPTVGRVVLALCTTAGEYTYALETAMSESGLEILPFTVEARQTMIVTRAAVRMLVSATSDAEVWHEIPLALPPHASMSADDSIHITGFTAGIE